MAISIDDARVGVLSYAESLTKAHLFAFGLFAWVLIVRAFRWKKYNAIHEQFTAKWLDGTLTPEEAQEVVRLSSLWDMPLLMNRALSFSLFKTFAIPSIAKLLLKTAETSTAGNVTKRYADTEILISTFVGCPISGFYDPAVARENKQCPNPRPSEDPRAMISLARINWIHKHYYISNDDYLYTLALFTLEPIYWAQRFGWRPLSPLEQGAFYIFWKDIGEKMNMKDIPATLEDMISWSRAFEERNMLPGKETLVISDYTIEELIYALPRCLKSLGRRVTISVMEERVRLAMRLPEQPFLVKFLSIKSLQALMMFQRFFMLPRSTHGLLIDIEMPKWKPGEVYGRLFPRVWRSRPWYSAEPKNVYESIRNRLMVAAGWFSELPGPHLRSEGYRIEQMGPAKFEQDGWDEVMREAARLQGCPVTGPLSLTGQKRAI